MFGLGGLNAEYWVQAGNRENFQVHLISQEIKSAMAHVLSHNTRVDMADLKHVLV
jgi:hypothetical protein